MRYVAFLRAINVTRRFVKMVRLQEPFTQLGFTNIETHIQSGNVIFDTTETDTSALEDRIAEALHVALEFEVPTFIRTQTDLAQVLAYQPFPKYELVEGDDIRITFLHKTPTEQAIEKLLSYTSELDEFHIHKREVYWLMHRHLGDSKLSNTRIEQILKMKGTQRNMNVLQTILEKYFPE